MRESVLAVVAILAVTSTTVGDSEKPAGSQSASGPLPVSTSGSIVHGGALTITGSGFGTREDFHSSTDKLIKMWDDFDDGELACSLYHCWHINNADAVAIAADHPRTARAGDRQYRRKAPTLASVGGLEFYRLGNHRQYFASVYVRLSDQFNIQTLPPEGCATNSNGTVIDGRCTKQFKVIRLWSNKLSETDDRENLYPAIGASDGWNLAAEHFSPGVLRACAQLEGIPNPPGPTALSTGWHKMTIFMEKSTAPGTNNGKLRIWWDNKLVFDWKQHFSSGLLPSWCPPITGDFDGDDGDFAWHLSLGNYFSSAPTSTYVEFDDLFLDHSQVG
ncbi:MAG: hypothetical protein LC808_04835 [Actinobacteria bacterium]|nr:hypothetical protein [Actinomycetota bacterium]